MRFCVTSPFPGLHSCSVLAARSPKAATFAPRISQANRGQRMRPPRRKRPRKVSVKPTNSSRHRRPSTAAINGPAGNPECVWLGRRVVVLMWRDDLDTAFRHLDLYDRFGCPGGHVQATFRCLVRFFSAIDPKVPDSLSGRVHACWINPAAQPQAAAAAQPAAPSTAGSSAPPPAAAAPPAAAPAAAPAK